MTYSTSGTSSSGSTWYNWNVKYSTSTSTSTASCNDSTWVSWNSPYSVTSTTGTADTCWYSWNTSNGRAQIRTLPRELTETEKQIEKDRLLRLSEEREKQKARAKALEEEKENAELRAKDLLLDLIGEKELAVYNETGRLFVKGNKFDYIIQKTGYIKQISKNKITDLCVHLDNRYKFPETDNVIAMKLAIESDEAGILKLANNRGSVKRPMELLKAACM